MRFVYLFHIILLVVSINARAQNTEVHEFVLDNGLQIRVQEDHRAPVVVSQVWYKVGSSYEYGGLTGISHVLEHMMFKGTQKYPAGQFSRIVAANGGKENAFTGDDYTAYYQRLERSKLAISFKLEADRMRNLKLTDEEFKKELQVVLEERRLRTEDKPRAKLYEHFMAMAYSNSPYRNPVIGWPDDIEHLTVDDLKTWYGYWYAPNNAVVVVVGDVRPQQVLALAKKYFGSVKASSIKALKPQAEVEQLGIRRMTIRLPANLPYLLMGYKVPVLNSVEHEWEAYALEVLSGILDGGDSSRLASRLVRGQQIAISAGAGYDLYGRLPSLFMLDATPTKGVGLAELEQALRAQVEDLQEHFVSPEELERVKAQVLAHSVYERDSSFNQAMQIGRLEAVGLGWRKINDYIERVNAVTANQIQSVARKYLIEDHLSIAILDPLPLGDKQKMEPEQSVKGGRYAN